MRIVLISALLFLAACSEGNGRYGQYGRSGMGVLDTRTGCLFMIEAGGTDITKDGSKVRSLRLRPLDKERC